VDKIVLIEEIDVLKSRIERLIKTYYSFEMDSVSAEAIVQVNMNYRFRSASLIIMDMDHLYGEVVNLIRQLRLIIQNDAVSIVVLSSSAEVALLKSVVKAGANDFIIKPFTDDQLVIKLSKGLDIHSHGSSVTKHKTPLVVSSLDDSQISNLPAIRMGALRWSDEFKIGIDQIDDEHRGIIERYEHLYLQMREGLGSEAYHSLLLFLKDYTDNHFFNEEAFQVKMGYSGYKEHRLLHETFRNQVNDLIVKRDTNSISTTDLVRFNLFVKDWLVHHVLVEDQKIALELKNR
jgi:hemerythrin